MKLLFIIIFISSASFAQVGNDDRVMSSWMGKHQSELFIVWGAPDRVSSDGRGGKILVFIEQYGKIRQEEPDCQFLYYDDNLRKIERCEPGKIIDDRYQAIRSFFVNPKGYIYNYRWEYR